MLGMSGRLPQADMLAQADRLPQADMQGIQEREPAGQPELGLVAVAFHPSLPAGNTRSHLKTNLTEQPQSINAILFS
jgi:hypothetical protein